jgi:hypothetical protein
MYYKTVSAKRTTGRKVKLVINEVVAEEKTTYFAKVIFSDMDFFVSLTPSEKRKLCGQVKN